MLKRKAYKYILNWYNQNLKKCLLVDGARQIGKTDILRSKSFALSALSKASFTKLLS